MQADARWYRGPSAKKGRDLIQYLGAYPRRVATVDELAEAFWPDLSLDAVGHASTSRRAEQHVPP